MVALSPGTRLGPYEIVAPLGAGGMGEVYRARDTRLGRDVAVKVLPAHLSENPELRARFEREAKTVSSLNHPHICVLYDVGREGTTDFLVMELIEGETLAQRIQKGPMPAEQALKIGIEIADALDRAHRAGIVHRDLKPGNVMLTKSGAKLMDFGLARAGAAATRPGSGSIDLTTSPTMTGPLTAEGHIVGTFQYMAPEQLEGGEADARSDLWALGCVLYELVTGRPSFSGKSQASLIGAIMSTQPAPVSTVVPLAPPAFDRLVHGCLEKDPEDRWQSARDVRRELEWIVQGGSQAGVPAPVAARRRGRERLAWIVAGVAALAAIGLGAFALLRPSAPRYTTRFQIPQPAQLRAIVWPRLSPDGRTVAFQGTDSAGVTLLWIRPLGMLDATPLPGTEGAGRPFWSPDGRNLGYFVGTQLKKVPVAGGPSQLVSAVKSGADGSWGSSGMIAFDGGFSDSIRGVNVNGGEVVPMTTIDRKAGELYHAWPWFLPDGKHFLYVAYGSNAQDTKLKVGSIDGKTSVSLGPVSTRVEYGGPGYVFFGSEGTLLARRFDARTLKFKGERFPVAEHVEWTTSSDVLQYSVTTTGAIAFTTGGQGQESQLLWIDRSGKALSTVGSPGGYRDLAFSPDGNRLAYGKTDPRTGNEDLWVRDLKRDLETKLTFDPDLNEVWPVWSPDGARIAFAWDAGGPYSLWELPASGTGHPDTLYRSTGANGPMDWSRDGKWFGFSNFDRGNPDVCVLSPDSPRDVTRLLASDYSETMIRFSPDGRWIVYCSDESNRREVYVRTFPDPSGKWQISTQGGTQPFWRADGRELFYLSGNALMAVPIGPGPGFEAGTPVRLFERAYMRGGILRNRYLPSPDGQRFLLNVPIEAGARQSFTVVQDWTAELAKK